MLTGVECDMLNVEKGRRSTVNSTTINIMLGQELARYISRATAVEVGMRGPPFGPNSTF